MKNIHDIWLRQHKNKNATVMMGDKPIGKIYKGCWSDDKKYGIRIFAAKHLEFCRRWLQGYMYHEQHEAEAHLIDTFNANYTGGAK